MPFSWEEIERDWLVGERLAAPSAVVVDAFNYLERLFGLEWVKSCRHAVGAIPTCSVVTLGRTLASLEGLAKADELIHRLNQNDTAAVSEATAIHLLRSAQPDVEIELFPNVPVGKRVRQPDFRVRKPGQDWTYVEVTRADVSDELSEVQSLLNRLTGVVTTTEKVFALEVFLRRTPTDAEVDWILQRIPAISSLDGEQTEHLPDGLGLLTLNRHQPGMVVVETPPGEAACPMVAQSMFVGGGNGPARHVVARVAYADERAKRFLSAEAEQLSKEHPNLIMIDMATRPAGSRRGLLCSGAAFSLPSGPESGRSAFSRASDIRPRKASAGSCTRTCWKIHTPDSHSLPG
jgi:hypothetical protein